MRYILNEWNIMKIFSYRNGIKVTMKEEQNIGIYEYENNIDRVILLLIYKLKCNCVFNYLSTLQNIG